jgi:hypothetical protein
LVNKFSQKTPSIPFHLGFTIQQLKGGLMTGERGKGDGFARASKREQEQRHAMHGPVEEMAF